MEQSFIKIKKMKRMKTRMMKTKRTEKKTILDPKCTSKTFPDYFDRLAEMTKI